MGGSIMFPDKPVYDYKEGWKTADQSQVYVDYYGSMPPYKIWIVHSNYISLQFDADWGGGGNHQAKPYVPEGEIWIGDDVPKYNVKYFIVHETFECNLMLQKKLSYEEAHERANELEMFLRRKDYESI